MKKNWHKVCFYRGLLHRKVGGEKPQLVLPTKYVPTVCKALNDDMGHQGYEKTLGLKGRAFCGQEFLKMSKGGFTTIVAI